MRLQTSKPSMSGRPMSSTTTRTGFRSSSVERLLAAARAHDVKPSRSRYERTSAAMLSSSSTTSAVPRAGRLPSRVSASRRSDAAAEPSRTVVALKPVRSLFSGTDTPPSVTVAFGATGTATSRAVLSKSVRLGRRDERGSARGRRGSRGSTPASLVITSARTSFGPKKKLPSEPRLAAPPCASARAATAAAAAAMTTKRRTSEVFPAKDEIRGRLPCKDRVKSVEAAAAPGLHASATGSGGSVSRDGGVRRLVLADMPRPASTRPGERRASRARECGR